MKREIPIRALPYWKRRELGLVAYWETTYIYGLVDPRDSIIRYVGQSIDTVGRFKDHCRQGRRTLRERGGSEQFALCAPPDEQMARVIRYHNAHITADGHLNHDRKCCTSETRAECPLDPRRLSDYVRPVDAWLATLATADLTPNMIELDIVPGRYERINEDGRGELSFYEADLAELRQIVKCSTTIYNWTYKPTTERAVKTLEDQISGDRIPHIPRR